MFPKSYVCNYTVSIISHKNVHGSFFLLIKAIILTGEQDTNHLIFNLTAIPTDKQLI